MCCFQIGSVRALAVAATNDLITTALQFMREPSVLPRKIQYLEDSKWTPPSLPPIPQGGLIQASFNLTLAVDDLLFSFILPSFEKVFYPQNYQKYSDYLNLYECCNLFLGVNWNPDLPCSMMNPTTLDKQS